MLAAGGTVSLYGGTILNATLTTNNGGVIQVAKSNSGSLAGATISKGSTVSALSGSTLMITGTNSVAGKVSGAGTLVAAGGTTTLNSGASLTVSDWTVSDSGTSVVLGENLTYAGILSDDSGTSLTLSGGNLTLTGEDAFVAATVTGSKILYAKGVTSVSDLTIGGTATFDNMKTVTESGGAVTVGDASGGAAKLLNASTGTWDITDDSGIARTSAVSSISNSGIFEKTGGTGTSVIAPKVANAGSILVSSGALDFNGAVSGTGTDTISGAVTLEFDSAVASGQTIDFSGSSGALDLIDPKGFSGEIEDFAATDSVDITGPWSLLSFSENSPGTLGTLTLAKGATHLALDFVGDYAANDFHIAAGSTTVIGHT